MLERYPQPERLDQDLSCFWQEFDKKLSEPRVRTSKLPHTGLATTCTSFLCLDSYNALIFVCCRFRPWSVNIMPSLNLDDSS